MSRSLFSCQNYRGKDKDLFVWGDSHARHLSVGLGVAYPDHNVYILHYAGCIPQSGYHGFVNAFSSDLVVSQCVRRNERALAYLTTGDVPRNIILTSAKRETPEIIAAVTNALVSELETAGNTVVVLGDFIRPGWDLVDCATVPAYLVSDDWRQERCTGVPSIARQELRYNDQLDQLVPSFVSINDIQCPGGVCQFFEDGMILFRDDDHLNDRGSVLMVGRLKPKLPF